MHIHARAIYMDHTNRVCNTDNTDNTNNTNNTNHTGKKILIKGNTSIGHFRVSRTLRTCEYTDTRAHEHTSTSNTTDTSTTGTNPHTHTSHLTHQRTTRNTHASQTRVHAYACPSPYAQGVLIRVSKQLIHNWYSLRFKS